MNSADLKIQDETGRQTLEVIAGADKFNKWMYGEIKPFLKGTILEIGGGIGNISKYLVADYPEITLSDYNPEYKEMLFEKFKPLSSIKEILQIDLLDKNFETKYIHLKGSFDTVFLLNVIEHVRDDAQAISNCRFLLKDDGYLLLLAPAYKFLFCKFDEGLGHFRRYTLRSMAGKVSSNGFEIAGKKYFNFPGIFGWLIFGKLLNREKIGRREMSTFNFLVPIARIIDKLIFHTAGLSVIVCGKKTDQ